MTPGEVAKARSVYRNIIVAWFNEEPSADILDEAAIERLIDRLLIHEDTVRDAQAVKAQASGGSDRVMTGSGR